MTTIYAIHAADDDKLTGIVAEMKTLGAPTIKVVDCGGHYRALEGSHRLAAAASLGLTPVLEIFEQDDLIEISGFDWFDACNWAETSYPAGEVACEIVSPHRAVAYTF